MNENQPTIVVVDDEKNVQNAVRRALRNVDVRVETADGAFDAIAAIKKRPEPPAAILADYRMPGMSGLQLLRKVKEISPSTVRILFTAYADMEMVIRAINEGEVYRFLQKPWDEHEMIEVVKNAVEYHALVKKNEELRATIQRQQEELAELEQSHPGITRLPPKDEEGAFIIEPPPSGQEPVW